MRKGHIKKTLTESYIKNIDYKIIKGELNGHFELYQNLKNFDIIQKFSHLLCKCGLKGKPNETILLTPKCFKLMAMQSKTKKQFKLENIIMN